MGLPLVIGVSFLLTDPELAAVLCGARYAEIKIEGNTDTPRRVIRSMLDVEQGGRIQLGKLRAAEQKLRNCPTLVTEVRNGIVPTVELEPNKESEFWDVVVRVKDTPGSWLGYELVDLAHYSVRALVFRDPLAAIASLNVLRYIAERVGR